MPTGDRGHFGTGVGTGHGATRRVDTGLTERADELARPGQGETHEVQPGRTSAAAGFDRGDCHLVGFDVVGVTVATGRVVGQHDLRSLPFDDLCKPRGGSESWVADFAEVAVGARDDDGQRAFCAATGQGTAHADGLVVQGGRGPPLAFSPSPWTLH